jgi:hypothetical protein
VGIVTVGSVVGVVVVGGSVVGVVVVGGSVVGVVVVGGSVVGVVVVGGAVVGVVVVGGGAVVVVVVGGVLFFFTVVGVVVTGGLVVGVVVTGGAVVVVAGAVVVVVVGFVVVVGGTVVVVVVGNGITRIGVVVVGELDELFAFVGCVVELPETVWEAVLTLALLLLLLPVVVVAFPVVVVAFTVVGAVVGFTVVVVAFAVVTGGCAPSAGYFTTVVVVGEASEGCVNDVACPFRNKRITRPVAASTPTTTSTSHLAQCARPSRFAMLGLVLLFVLVSSRRVAQPKRTACERSISMEQPLTQTRHGGGPLDPLDVMKGRLPAPSDNRIRAGGPPLHPGFHLRIDPLN